MLKTYKYKLINQQTTIDRIPVEILRIIFARLSLGDLLACKKVCKQWQSLVETFKFDSLVVYADRPPAKKWFYSNEKVDCLFSLSICDYSIDSLQLKEEHLTSSIRSLYIYSPSDSYIRCFDLGHSLNHFKQLERLEISNLDLQTESQLTLPNLKTFSILTTQNSVLILNTFQLENLKIGYPDSLDRIIVTYPYKIRRLECMEFDRRLYSFVNLEHFFCKCFYEIDSDFLKNRFKKLSHLSFNHMPYVFDELQKQSKRLKNRQVNIYFLGFKFNVLPENSGFFTFNTSVLDQKSIYLFDIFYLVSAVILPFIKFVDYSVLEDHFGAEIPEHFAKKLVNLDELTLTKKPKYPQQFGNFLKECAVLPTLKLRYSTGELYNDLLDRICPFVQVLELEEQLPIESLKRLFQNFDLFLIKIFDKILATEFNFKYTNGQLELATRKQNSVELIDAFLVIPEEPSFSVRRIIPARKHELSSETSC